MFCLNRGKSFFTLLLCVVVLVAVVVNCLPLYMEAYVNNEEKYPLTEGSNIRIMSFNLLCELWNDKVPVEGRDKDFNKLLKIYEPDVVGIQEVSDMWYQSLDKYLGNRYAVTDRKNGNGETNFSTLIYNTKKVKLIEHDTKIYSAGNDPRLRLVSWGLFEKNDTKERFIVTSTHWDIGSNENMITIQAAEMAIFVEELIGKYDVPVICTGDFNRRSTSKQFSSFMDYTKFIDSNKAEIVTEQDAKAQTIDHIVASDNVSFKYFVILRDELASGISDHKPLFADLGLLSK